MNKFVLLASIALLASCGKKDAAPDATASDAAMASDMATPAAMAVETPAAGSYDVTDPKGTKSTTTLMADGTFVDRDAHDKVTDKGTWAVKDGKTCFTGNSKTEDCYTESARAADGSFTATDAKGGVTQVKPHVK